MKTVYQPPLSPQSPFVRLHYKDAIIPSLHRTVVCFVCLIKYIQAHFRPSSWEGMISYIPATACGNGNRALVYPSKNINIDTKNAKWFAQKQYV